jgi:hypothetical protein
VKVGTTGLQLSVAVAVPKAALMVAASGLQPNVRVVPEATITGFTASVIANVWLQVFVQPFKLTVSVSVYVPQVVPPNTDTVWLVDDPVIVPFPEMVQE